MRKENLLKQFKGVVFVFLVIVLVGVVGEIFARKVGAENVIACLSIEFNPTPDTIVLGYAGGGYQAKEVSVHITAKGVSDFDLQSEYRFAYYVQGSEIVQRGLSFDPSADNLPGTPAADRKYEAWLTFNIDKPGNWFYTLETRGSVVAVGGAESCPASQENQWRQFSIVSADPVADQIISGDCAVVSPPELANNHFTCTNLSGSWYVSDDASVCDSGYTPDTVGCPQGLSPSGAPLSGTSCIPCLSISEQKTQLSHLDQCGENDTTECDRGKVGLVCSTVTNDGDPWKGHSRCIYTTPSLGPNELCYRGLQECSTATIDGFVYSCQPAEGTEPYLGKCLPDASAVRCSGTEVPHPFCESKGFGPNAYCDTSVGVCREGAPASPPDTPTTPPFDDTSTDFGIQNCPYSEGSGTAIRFKPQAGILAGTAEYDRQRAEHYQCITCVAGGNSWTAIGCIDVSSPEGIFTSLIRLGIGTMGGVALLRMIWLGVIMGQSDNDGKVKEAWQGILATLGGITVVVFSVLIIRIVAVNILNVVPPGFFGL